MLPSKDKLKKIWFYKHLRRFVIWPFDFVHWLPKYIKWFLMAYQKNWMIDPCSRRRARIWKWCGVKTSGKFNVGYDVYFDAQNAKYLTIEDGVWISSRCTILCHKRDISNYCIGDVYIANPSKISPVHIERNAAIGMDSMIMPGVTIGEGAVIGSGSLVTKDVPAWTVAIGRPAKVVRTLKVRKIGD